jgi:2-polyprenyl-3-methyl-5-hydroxy-6-metoxy-1,4-benzoquinol methylase
MVSSYDEIAEWYDNWVGTHSMSDDPYFGAVEALMGEITGQRICDLACGQGRVARHLADRGARVVGIDLSAKLLAIARHHEETSPRGIEYVHADVQRLEDAAFDPFDEVVCSMALMDIPDLGATVRGVASLLRAEGWFASSILASIPPSRESWSHLKAPSARSAATLWRAIGVLTREQGRQAR